MPIVRQSDSRSFTLPGLTVVGLASPLRGATETAVWRLRLDGGTPGTPHRLTREEIFVGLSGRALATLDGVEHGIAAGEALIVPPHTTFALANPHETPFEAMVAFPIGGQAVTDGAPFTPPWAE